MHTLYVLSVFLHIVSATIWMGGMLFLVLVVVPWLRAEGRGRAGAFLRETGERFRSVGWWCFAVLAVTGAFNLHVRGVGLTTLVQGEFWRGSFGRTLGLKLALVVTVWGVSWVHDFVVGPRATRLIEAAPQGPEANRVRKLASRLGRINVILGLLIVLLAVMLVRGVPF
ncbi:MAG TPA: CopD family protein [Polyangiaceae bacterium]|nr:CopD family protein [Polyangiaceae bacterium]